MANNRVQGIKTPISEPEMAQAVLQVVMELYGLDLSKEQLALIIAQNNLETGHRKSMYNYNIGNISHTNNDGFDYFIHQDKSGKDMKLMEQISPGNWVPMTMKFRAYPDLLSGVKDYIKNLHDRAGGKVWTSILNADPVKFSKTLKQSKYYTANEEDYIDTKTGKTVPGYTSGIVSATKSFLKSDSYEKAKNISPTNVIKEDNMLDKINKLVEKYLGAFGSERFNKKIAYKNSLTPNTLVIKIFSDNLDASIEFSRILCQAIDEELYSDAYTHTDLNNIEVEANINGPSPLVFKTTDALCKILAEEFTKQTKFKVDTKIINCNKSNMPELTYKIANSSYNNFRLNLINNNSTKQNAFKKTI